jgi:hypothetical protein
MEEFEMNPLALEYHYPRWRAVLEGEEVRYSIDK